ncbi:MAG: pyridoxamine 5'-phosphate oxidase [Gammaproteobacteria bacterium]|nr:pyridoxamine 5'-phosphate oxidase [Gammaproteobacteria bacterium]
MPSTAMTAAEKQQFLTEPHVGVLSIPRPGAGPLTVPVWYDYRPGGELWFLTGRESRKGRLLEVGTRVSLCTQTETAPYQYVSVEGPVTALDEERDELLPMAIRYLGEAQGRAYAEHSREPDSVVVRMAPERWLAVDYRKLL